MINRTNSIESTSEQSTNDQEDALLNCLVWFTQYFHKPFSHKALTAGLPLENNLLTPALFIRAAGRAHLTVVLRAPSQKNKISSLPASAFPLILFSPEKNSARIVLNIDNNQACILDPALNMGMIKIPLDTLDLFNKDNTPLGKLIIFIKPAYEFSERSQENFNEKQTDSRNANIHTFLNKNWFWSIILKVWPLYGEVIAGSLLINLFALAIPLFVMNVYDRVVPNQAIETLWVLAIGVYIVFIFDFIMRLLRSYFIDIAGKSVDVKLSAEIFEQILGIKMHARPASIGAFANTIQSFESFRDFITSSTVTVLVDLPFVFIFIVLIILIGGSLAWVSLITVPIIVLTGWIIQIPLTSLSTLSYQYANEKQGALIETLGGIETIKTLGAEGAMQKRWEQVTLLAARCGVKLRVFSNLNVYFSLFAQQIAYIIVVIWGVYKIGSGELTTGALIACTILTSRALSPMSQVVGLLSRYYQTRHALKALNQVMQLPIERPAGKHFLHRPRLKGAIECRQVTFSYPDQPLPALKNISFRIQPGEKVGFIGRMGSGKTTLSKLILGLYQPQSGLILMDDIDQHQIDIAELRHNLGYVSQEVMLFYGSLKDNIAFSAPYSDDASILKAAQISGVEQFTRTHPQGLDMQIGEKGTHLSGGQRQCVAFARAILSDPPIIILDEATNSIDESTEQFLKHSIQTHLDKKTLIIITHKPSILSLVNRLIIIDSGQIIADGPKDDVLKALTENKIYVPKA